MRPHSRIAVVAAGLLALAGAIMAVSPPASAGDVGARVTAWVSCDDGPPGLLTVQPVNHVLSCADGNSGLKGLTWSTWGVATARGTGVYYWNDCTPSCAAGTTHESRASVVLSRVRIQHGEPVFTHVVIRYRDENGVPQVESGGSVPWLG